MFKTSLSLLSNHLLSVFLVLSTVQVIGNLHITWAHTFPSGSHSLDCALIVAKCGLMPWTTEVHGPRYQGTCIPKGTFGGYASLSSLCFMCIWDLSIFVSFYLCIVAESLLGEFTSGENIYFSNSVAKNLSLDDSKSPVFSCPS